MKRYSLTIIILTTIFNFIWSLATPISAVAAVNSRNVVYTQVSVGGDFACGITDRGGVICAGQNNLGQLDIPPNLTEKGVQVSGIKVAKLALGGDYWGGGSTHNSFACALMTDESVQCWGEMWGHSMSAPAMNDAIDLQAAGGRVCVLHVTGMIQCWSSGGTSFDQAIPQYPTGTYKFLGVSYNTDMCALNTSDQIVCVGYWDHPYASNIPTFSNQITYIGSGRYGECAIDNGNFMQCWGQSRYPNIQGVAAYVNGESTECLLYQTGEVNCIATGGDGYPTSSWSVPSDLPMSQQIAIGSTMVCSLSIEGSITCWGPMAPVLPSSIPFTVPDTPTVNVPTRPGSGQLAWTWSPNDDGGTPISKYTWSGACSGSGDVLTITCSGLTGGTNYTLNVTATNAVGTSSAGSSSLVATTEPLPPTVSSPTRPASGQLTWTWSPNSDGGSSITEFSWSGACSGSGLVTTVTCSGLTGGTNYTLNVTATNAVGASSAGSSSLLATSIPAAPTVNAPSSPTSGQLTWTWSPNSDGGSAITSYSWTGACSGSGLVTTVTCSGLTGGTNYTLSVTATNGVGTSGSGSRSGIALTIPSAPIVNASPANGALSVTWAAPTSNGGTSITGYTATATTAGNSYSCTSTTLSCAITGLTNGTTYSVSVVATNAQGNSSASNVVSIYPAPDTKFLAYSPNAVVLVKSNFQVLVANAKAGALVTVATAGATKTCTANAVGECSVTLNSSMSSGWVIVASYIDGKKTVSTSGSYRVNIANVTVSSVQIAKGKSFTVKIASGGPGTKFQVVASSGTTYSVTLTSSGAGTITVATKAKGPLTLLISDNGILLQTTTVAVV